MNDSQHQSGTLGQTNERERLPSTWLLVLLGPVLIAGIATAGLAALAGLFGFQREEMLLTAGVVGGAVLALAVWLQLSLIADRKAAHRALENIEARAMDIINSAMDAIITLDEEQRIVVFNAAAERIFGWPREKALGKPFELLLPERLRAPLREQIERFGMGGATLQRMGEKTALAGLRSDGTEFPIDVSVSQLSQDEHRSYTVILRDISRRVRAEGELARSEARLRGIIDSAMDAVITIDEGQNIVLFNESAEKVFRCPAAQAIGSHLSRFIPERFRRAHERHIERFGATGETSRRMGRQTVVIGLRADGEEFPTEASISQISSQGTKLYTVILRDVTERVRAEEELRRSRQELRELAAVSHDAREQEKSRLARELHDELGQALTALKMDVSWLAERLPPVQAPLAAKVRSMQGLLDGTVAAARRISADLRPLLLDDLGLVAAAEWLATDFRQRTGIACEFASDMPESDLGDLQATAVFRMLQECLTNIARHARATQVEVTLERAGGELVLTVRDNGCGFDTAAPRKSGSYGLLGLRERANLLGGRVIITSASGQGTIVEVHVPVGGAPTA